MTKKTKQGKKLRHQAEILKANQKSKAKTVVQNTKLSEKANVPKQVDASFIRSDLLKTLILSSIMFSIIAALWYLNIIK